MSRLNLDDWKDVTVLCVVLGCVTAVVVSCIWSAALW
jgi:hypothetical protein